VANEPYQTLASKTVYEGLIIDVHHYTIVLPDGREAVREVVVHGGASAIVPVDDEGNLIFVRQYRQPARQMVLEIPAGTLEKGEDPLVCATRELEEETSFQAGEMTFLTKMYSAIGFCTEVLYIYVATGLRQGQFHLDEDEFIEVERYPLAEAVQMVFDGRIVDSKTMVGVLAYREWAERRRAE